MTSTLGGEMSLFVTLFDPSLGYGISLKGHRNNMKHILHITKTSIELVL